MARQVIKYESNNGTLHDSMLEAEEYDKRRAFIKTILAKQSKSELHIGSGAYVQAEILAVWIQQNKDLVLTLL